MRVEISSRDIKFLGTYLEIALANFKYLVNWVGLLLRT